MLHFSVCLSADGHLCWFLVWMWWWREHQWTWMYAYLCAMPVLSISGIYLRVSEPSHVVYLLLSWGTSTWLPCWLHLFTFPAAACKGSSFPNPCQHLLSFVFLMTTVLTLMYVFSWRSTMTMSTFSKMYYPFLFLILGTVCPNRWPNYWMADLRRFDV